MMRKIDTQVLKDIEDEILDEIYAAPLEELESSLAELGMSGDGKMARLEGWIHETLLEERKSLLKMARNEIDLENQDTTPAPARIGSVEAAHAFIIDFLTSQQNVDTKLTAAFREGKDLPDKDLIDLANDLLDLQKENDSEE